MTVERRAVLLVAALVCLGVGCEVSGPAKDACVTTADCLDGNVCSGGHCTSQCAPETTEAFCARLRKNCDVLTAVDNCQRQRSENCGTCTVSSRCVNNECQAGGGTGGGSGGGSGGFGGGATGGATGGSSGTCDGCKLPSSGVCVSLANTSVVNCGEAGATCVACSSGQTCQGGTCTSPDAGTGDGGACGNGGPGSFVLISNASELAAFAQRGCDGYAGRLMISNSTDISSLSLPLLTTVEDLEVEGNTALTGVSLPALTSVGGLGLQGNTALTALSLPALATGSYVDIVNNAALTSLSFPVLTSLSAQLYVDNNSVLVSMSLPALTAVGQDMHVTNNAALRQCVVDAIKSQLSAVPGLYSAAGNTGTPNTCP